MLSDLSPVQDTSQSQLSFPDFEAGEFTPNVVSPSLQNLRGSIEDMTMPTSPVTQPITR